MIPPLWVVYVLAGIGVYFAAVRFYVWVCRWAAADLQPPPYDQEAEW